VRALAAKYLAEWIRENPHDAVWERANVMEVTPTRIGWDVKCSFSPAMQPKTLEMESGYRYLIISIRQNGEFAGVSHGYLII
jgi:hypothetical protein